MFQGTGRNPYGKVVSECEKCGWERQAEIYLIFIKILMFDVNVKPKGWGRDKRYIFPVRYLILKISPSEGGRPLRALSCNIEN